MGRLSIQIADSIMCSLPLSFVFESVFIFKEIHKGKTFKTVMKKLDAIRNGTEQAYHIEHQVIDSNDFGVPQSRARLFIVAPSRLRRSQSSDGLSPPVPPLSVVSRNPGSPNLQNAAISNAARQANWQQIKLRSI